MNCFNIREIQSILKRRFFVDLINGHDHRDLLHKTMVNLKFKTNNISAADPNLFIFYNYGVELTPKNRTTEFANFFKNMDTTFNKHSVIYNLIDFLKHSLVLKLVHDVFSNV